MNPQADIDPTAGRVLGHDAGQRFDQGLEQLTDLELTMLYEAALGLTVRRISRKHRVPEAVVDYVISTVEVRQNLTLAGITSADAADMYSPLAQRLEWLAAPRCKFCHAVLRKALEPRKRGRPASYCDAVCRTAAAKDPAAPKWLTGYVGTCKNYQHGCKCLRKDEIAFEDDLVILTPSKEILILGTAVGHLGVQPDADDPATTVWLNAILRPYERGLLSRSAGMPIEFVPTADVARHTAIRLCASALRREGGIRRVLITVPDRPAKLVAQGFGFRTAATKRHASGTMVWDLDRHAPPPTHVVA